MPLQDWQEYTFSVDTAVPPQLVFRNDEFTGVRINKIIYEIGQAGNWPTKLRGRSMANTNANKYLGAGLGLLLLSFCFMAGAEDLTGTAGIWIPCKNSGFSMKLRRRSKSTGRG